MDIEDNSDDLFFYNDIRYILTSKIRLNILLALYDGDKSLIELKELLENTETSIFRSLKELEDLDLIVKNEKSYSLSSTGFLLTSNIGTFIDNWYTVKDNNVFWETHSIDNIPLNFIRNMTYWKDCEMIETTDTKYMETVDVYKEYLLDSKELRIVLPIFSKRHLNVILNTVKNNNADLTLITEERIIDLIKKAECNELFEQLIQKDKIKICLSEEPLDMFLTCADNFYSLSLFYSEGDYDDSMMLLNTDEKLIKNINILFDTYKEHFFKLSS